MSETPADGAIPVIVWGASGHAKVVADLVRLRSRYRIVGFIDDVNAGAQGRPFAGVTVLGGRDALEDVRRRGVRHLVVAFGDCEARVRTADIARELGFDLITAVHPRAVIASDVVVGAGTVVMAGAVVNSGARIGTNVIVNTGATVDHDCMLGDGVHISPGAHLGGHVTVGCATWVGIGATVVDHLTLGSYSIVGAGAVVTRDIPDRVVVYGVPARVRRTK